MAKIERCFICNEYKLCDTHHIFNGYAFRKKSDEDGLVVMLCRECHEETHRNRALRVLLKKIGQWTYEHKKGSHEAFMERYKVNYLDGETDRELSEELKRWQKNVCLRRR